MMKAFSLTERASSLPSRTWSTKSPAESVQAHLHQSSLEGLEEGLLERKKAASPEKLEQRLIEKREASPQVTATEGCLGKREASLEVSPDKKAVTVKTTVTKSTSLARLETNVIVYVDDELEIPQQKEVKASETEKSLVQDCDVKRKRVRAFFRGLWKMMTCCVHVSTED
ncbi:uncharacterized protein AKAME5_001096300 [Lates japonicus]|uniref:Uncharacterized protein n=1 Tax=Lates japonicus TaxID=270547 RepID=A0AAD3R685_LATJO|nr:uncharacterized protein AKAME5_001096300 [Lates japonicus]